MAKTSADAFFGRTDELRWIRANALRRRVVVVQGRGGIGKTALVRHALKRHELFAIDLRPGDGERRVWLELVRALSRRGALPIPSDDSTGALAAVALESRELGSFVVVVDDVHHLPEDDVRSLVGRCRDAHHGQFVLIGRRFPSATAKRSELLVVDDLDASSLRRLARSIARGVTRRDLDRMVGISDGSPWLMRHLVDSGAQSPPKPEDVLSALSRRASPIIELLGRLELAIDVRTVRDVTGSRMPSHPDLVRTDDRVRLHDALRDVRGAHGADGEVAQKLAAASERTKDPAAAIEAIRLALSSGDVATAADVLRAQLDAIVSAGLGERLFAMIGTSREPALSAHRLHVATRLGGRALEEVLSDPRPADEMARVRHAEALIRASRLTEAKRLLESLPSGRDVDYLGARVAFFTGDLERAESLLRPRADDARARAQLAVIFAATGRYDEALRAIDELGASLPESGFERRQIDFACLEVYAMAGRLEEVLRRSEQLVRGAFEAGRPWESLSLAIHRAALEAERGELALARTMLDDVRSAARRSSTLSCEVNAVDARIALIEGNLRDAVRLADDCIADASTRNHHIQVGWKRVLRAQIADVEGDSSAERLEGVVDAQRRLLGALASASLARRGEASPEIDLSPEPLDAFVVSANAAATRALAEGQLEAAEKLARDAIAVAKRHQYFVYEMEARLRLFDVLLVRGRLEAAKNEAEALLRWGRDRGSPRFVAEGTFARSLLERSPDVPALEETAQLSDRAPTAARRARDLLRGTPGPDRIDPRVLAARVWTSRIRSVGEEGAPSWGADLVRGVFWVPGASPRKLGTSDLAGRLLATLVEHGGTASKETLVREVWGIKEYHPLRDDKRLQVGVMRLRRLLGEPSKARKITSRPDGYAIGELMRLVDGPH